MANDRYIVTEYDGAVAIVTLNRPNVLNALNRKLMDELVSELERLDQQDDVRVIVLTGSKQAFAAGADIDEMANEDPIILERLNQFAVWDRIALIKKPLIGAISGYALGGGFELALNCDLLFASDTASFGFPEVNIGVMPGAGGTQRLTKAIGKVRALEWLFSGERMSAQQALELGIINRVYETEILMEETIAFAKTLSHKPPLSLRLIKEAVHKAVDAPLQDGLQLERKNFYLLFSSKDQKEGMQAFLEKRKPNFEGR